MIIIINIRSSDVSTIDYNGETSGTSNLDVIMKSKMNNTL